MRIVVLATSFPRWDGDHAGRFVRDLSRGLVELGHRICHVVPEAEGAAARETEGEGYEVRRVPFALLRSWRGLAYGRGIGANLKSSPGLVLAVPSLLRALERGAAAAATEMSADLLLTHWVFPCGVIGARLRPRLGLPHVSIAHGGGLQLLAARPWWHPRLRRWARGVDHAVFVSRDLESKARAVVESMPPASVCAMGVDRALFEPSGAGGEVRKRLGVKPGELLVVAVARLVALKGIDLVVEAVRGVDGVRLAIAGEGPEREALERLAEEGGARVTFLGSLSPPELAPLYEAADVVVVPSRLGPRGRSEGSPMVVAEALTSGTPVIASRSGGIEEMVSDGRNGRLFDIDDVDALRDRIVALRDDRRLLDDLRAGAVVSAARYDYTRVAGHFDEVFAGLVESREGR